MLAAEREESDAKSKAEFEDLLQKGPKDDRKSSGSFKGTFHGTDKSDSDSEPPDPTPARVLGPARPAVEETEDLIGPPMPSLAANDNSARIPSAGKAHVEKSGQDRDEESSEEEEEDEEEDAVWFSFIICTLYGL